MVDDVSHRWVASTLLATGVVAWLAAAPIAVADPVEPEAGSESARAVIDDLRGQGYNVEINWVSGVSSIPLSLCARGNFDQLTAVIVEQCEQHRHRFQRRAVGLEIRADIHAPRQPGCAVLIGRTGQMRTTGDRSHLRGLRYRAHRPSPRTTAPVAPRTHTGEHVDDVANRLAGIGDDHPAALPGQCRRQVVDPEARQPVWMLHNDHPGIGVRQHPRPAWGRVPFSPDPTSHTTCPTATPRSVAHPVSRAT
jgi:hypothetical protein